MKYSNITTMEQFKNFLKDVDAAETWDAFETEEWESACEFAGINYHDYDDPDFLFDDLQNILESVNEDEEADDHFDGDIVKEYK